MTISLGEAVLTCFICDLNNLIKLNNIYLVELEIEVFDELRAKLATYILPKTNWSFFRIFLINLPK